MKALRLAVCLLLVSIAAFGQGANGTITGTVTDATGAVVVNARVEAKHVDTGAVYPTVSTDTGNYSLVQLPVGKYEVTVNVQGFKKYERTGLTLTAAQIMVIDVPLQVGSNTEAVTVTAEATLLISESSELVHNVTGTMMQELPIMALGGAGSNLSTSSGFRDPFALTKLIPGIQYAPNSMVANGNGDRSIRVEGQPQGNLGGLNGFTGETQPSVDAIQEVAVQTSNYAAELGGFGGAIVNMTMKSGTNQYHGSLYDYAANEALNAYPEMHQTGRTQTRRSDYGGTLGGPVNIPKLYKGNNKTFFFWGFEQFRENLLVTNTPATVPMPAYRVGEFQDAIIGSGQNGVPLQMKVGANLYMDQLGRTGFFAGQIFDPYSGTPVTCVTNGLPGSPNCTNGTTSIVRNPFPQVNGAFSGQPTVNQLPQNAAYINTTAQNIQQLFPQPIGTNSLIPNTFVNNFQNPWQSHRTSQIPSLKLDESIGSKGHLSFYWNTTVTESQFSVPLGNNEGFPLPITEARGTFIFAKTIRLNYDHTITPSLLFHIGGGYSSLNFNDHSPVVNNGGYNACPAFTTLAAAQTTGGIGLCGGLQNRTFPVINIGVGGTTGGMTQVGPLGNIQSQSYEQRPMLNMNVTWVKGNHNFKLGFEGRTEGYPAAGYGADGQYIFGGSQTGQPGLGDTGGAFVSNSANGFGYASYLMGLTSTTSLTAPTASKLGQNRFGLFLQDTWKITRKLTLDYGVRWDYDTYSSEEFGRADAMSLTVSNPNAGGHPGGTMFEANCGNLNNLAAMTPCKFLSSYPFQIGPRVGFAYQIDRKTVFRGGAGIVYQASGLVGGIPGVTLTSLPGPNPGDPSTGLSGCPVGLNCGSPLGGVLNMHPVWPDLSAKSGFTPGTVQVGFFGGAPPLIDPGSMRTPRIAQFSAGIQREVHRNLVVEASYVGNRGIWLPAGGFDQIGLLTPQFLTQQGFAVPVNGNVTAADLASRGLLLQSLGTETPAQNSALALQGIGTVQLAPCLAHSCPSLPYVTYPTSQRVNATITPFPQYGAITPGGSPLGFSWYDSLQIVATQRLSHGLSFNANYTYAKSLGETGSTDPQNPSLGKTYTGSDIPHQLRISADYVVPRIHSGNKILGNKTLAYILGDWGLGVYGQYQSGSAMNFPSNVTGAAGAVNTAAINQGAPAGTSFCPAATTPQGCSNAISDWLGYGPGPAQLIPGMSPWSTNWTDLNGVVHNTPIDINCHCFDPTKTDVLNPAAFVSIPTGTFGAQLQSNVLRSFRGPRLPTENMNVSRNFRIKERVTLQIRVEFTNAFNRFQLISPSTGSYTSANTSANGLLTGGYGTFSNIQSNGAGNPRAGTFVARFQF